MELTHYKASISWVPEKEGMAAAVYFIPKDQSLTPHIRILYKRRDWFLDYSDIKISRDEAHKILAEIDNLPIPAIDGFTVIKDRMNQCVNAAINDPENHDAHLRGAKYWLWLFNRERQVI